MKFPKKGTLTLSESPRCESCGPMDAGTLIVFDGNTWWCLDCADTMDLGKKKLVKAYGLQADLADKITSLFNEYREKLKTL